MQPHPSDTPLPLIGVAELREVLGLGDTPASTLRVLTAAGLPPNALADPRGYLGVDAVWRLFSAQIAATGDELLGLGTHPHPAGVTEVIVARCMHASSLEQAIGLFCETANLLLRDLRLSFKPRHNELLLNAVFPHQIDRRHQLWLEIACMPWHCTFCWLSGRLLPLARFVTHPSRRSAGTQLLAMFGCPVEYHGDGITLVYQRETLAGTFSPPPLVHWRQRIYDLLLEQIRGRQASLAQRDIVTYVDRALRQGVMDQAAIATSAGMSLATLRRHLARRDQDFRSMRDAVRDEHALQLLHAGHTDEAIAGRLGFSEARSFRRSFRRLHGESPATARRRIRNGAER
ncbi:AraC family transcriptional regulator ligand-binding domain-containing protein [Haliea sp.]